MASSLPSADSKQRFSARVENYVKYRPAYPPQLLSFMRDVLKLETSHLIADIGSGTGKLAQMFLQNGNTVFGIEPNVAMRRAGEALLSGFTNFRSINAAAENTMLESESVDFIVAGQAFHWFDLRATRREFARILKSKGFVVLVWNLRLPDGSAFARDYENLLLSLDTDYLQVKEDSISESRIQEFFACNKNQIIEFSNHQIFDYQGLLGRTLSCSFVPLEGEPKFEMMTENLRRIFDAHAVNKTIEFEYRTRVFYGHLK